MPNTRITGLTEDTTPADDDLVATVDVSDTTQSAQGSTKKVQAQNLVVKKLRTSTGPAVLTVGAVADGEFLKRDGTMVIGSTAPAADINAFDFKASVRVATTANITLSGTQTIDGVSVIAGDRVLVKNQSTGSQNGIYVCDAGAWSRAADADSSSEVTAGMFVPVAEGTTNGDTSWLLTTNDPITLGTTSLTFAQIGTGGTPGGSSGDLQYNDGAGGFAGAPLVREDADTVGLYDTSNTAANPSRLNVYALKDGATVERLSLRYDTGNSSFHIDTNNSGGTTRRIWFSVNGTPYWQISTTGHFTAWDAAARLFLSDGSSSSPSIQFGGGSGTSFKGMYSPATADIGFTTSSTYRFRIADAGVMLGANDGFLFSSTALGSGITASVGIHRHASGVAEINDGTKGNSGCLLLRGRTFAQLPASPVAGMEATVTDSNTTTWGATIAGGGSNNVKARYNGTNWTVVGI